MKVVITIRELLTKSIEIDVDRSALGSQSLEEYLRKKYEDEELDFDDDSIIDVTDTGEFEIKIIG